MADDNIPQYAALLRRQYIFQGLDDAQMAHVVSRLERLVVPPGYVVIEEGTPGATFYIIYSGRVQVLHTQHQQQVRLGTLGPGEYFGEEALLFDRPRSASFSTLEQTVLLRLDRDSFHELLEQVPDIRLNLAATAESRYLVHREKFKWLSEDEVIYLIARKHELFLYLSLLPPLALGIISIPVFAWGFTELTPFFAGSGLALGVLGMLAAITWGIWNGIDWGNDYYIVTSQRVVWLERVIIFYYSRREAPLTQVLSVNTKSTFWGQVFGYGNVEVRTYTGGILMRNCSDPRRFATYVENYQSRAKRDLKMAASATMRDELSTRLEVGAPPASAEAPAATKKPKPTTKPSTLRDKLDTFLQLRYVRDRVITYRKHWLVLFGKTWLPLVTGLLLTVGYLWGVYLDVMKNRPVLSILPLTLLYLLLLFFAFLWWGYNYLDWSDDIYQLTPEQVLDIERKPLGDEIKKSAPLDSILSIEHEREGIIRLLFNFGNVVINVGQTQFIFLGVHNPDQVHQDVADYIEARRRSKEEAQYNQEKQRMGEWFASYHDYVKAKNEDQNDSEWDLFPG